MTPPLTTRPGLPPLANPFCLNDDHLFVSFFLSPTDRQTNPPSLERWRDMFGNSGLIEVSLGNVKLLWKDIIILIRPLHALSNIIFYDNENVPLF